MTKERIKELAEKWQQEKIDVPWPDVGELIRTVAAESRAEGIDEMLKAALFYRDDPLRQIAKRLKEQG